MKKGVINLFLVISLVFPYQLFADNLGDIFNTTSVSTDFGTWDSPRTGTRYFYGGSYRFAFKGKGHIQPLFQGSPPSLKVGCNGFSISGGFLALLGIPEIKTMLSSAGATLAWGLMMGLEYSMPALAAVFSKLRQWAREIQSLLSSMCNIGKALGTKWKNSAQDGVVNTNLIGDINGLFEGVLGGMEKVEGNVKKALGEISGTIDCDILTAGASAQCKNQTAMTTGTLVKTVSNGVSHSLLSLSIGSISRTDQSPSNSMHVSKLSSFLNDGKIGNKVVVSNMTQLAEMRSTILLGRLFFGDIAIPFESVQTIFKKMNTTVAGTTLPLGSFPIDPNTAVDDYLSRQMDSPPADDAAILEGMGGVSIIPPVVSSSEQLAKSLLYGITPETQADYCIKGVCDIPDTYVLFMDAALRADSNGSQSSAQLIGNAWSPEVTTPGSITINWDGAFMESLKIIRWKIKNSTGFAPSFPAQEETNATVMAPTEPTITVPLLLPNIDKYIDVISRLERKSKKETAYTAHLKTMLARHNSYFFATSLIDLITGNVIDALGSKGDPVGSASSNESLRSYIELLYVRKNEIEKKIKEDQDNQISYHELTETFEAIEKQLQKETMKGF